MKVLLRIAIITIICAIMQKNGWSLENIGYGLITYGSTMRIANFLNSLEVDNARVTQ